jgi:hypothetical protein
LQQALEKHKAALNAELARIKIQEKATHKSDLIKASTDSGGEVFIFKVFSSV